MSAQKADLKLVISGQQTAEDYIAERLAEKMCPIIEQVKAEERAEVDLLLNGDSTAPKPMGVIHFEG